MRKRLLLVAIVPIILLGSLNLNANPTNNESKFSVQRILDDYPRRIRVDITIATASGCTIHIWGTVNEDFTGFIGTLTISGGDCVLYGQTFNFTIPLGSPIGIGPVNPGPPKGIISFVGGDSFCNATGVSFSGSSVSQDALNLLNLNSNAILTGFKSDIGC